MKILAFAVLVCAALAAAAGDTQSLVEAAKGAKDRKKKSTTKVITNADVKKSKGVVVVNQAPAPAVVAPQKGLAEQAETSYRERLQREVLLTVATKHVADLESELAAAEQSYYEENDLDKRDREVVKHFNDVKSRLDAARKELEALAPPKEHTN